VASAEKARRELGWRPRHAELRTILEHAWAWHRRHPAGYAERG
jgi:UDP-glucose 4-epimerase